MNDIFRAIDKEKLYYRAVIFFFSPLFASLFSSSQTTSSIRTGFRLRLGSEWDAHCHLGHFCLFVKIRALNPSPTLGELDSKSFYRSR